MASAGADTVADSASAAYLAELAGEDRARVATLSGVAHCIGGDNRLAMIVRRLLLPCGVLQDRATEPMVDGEAPTETCMHACMTANTKHSRGNRAGGDDRTMSPICSRTLGRHARMQSRHGNVNARDATSQVHAR